MFTPKPVLYETRQEALQEDHPGHALVQGQSGVNSANITFNATQLQVTLHESRLVDEAR